MFAANPVQNVVVDRFESCWLALFDDGTEVAEFLDRPALAEDFPKQRVGIFLAVGQNGGFVAIHLILSDS